MKRVALGVVVAPLAFPAGCLLFGYLVQTLTDAPEIRMFREAQMIAFYGTILAYPLMVGAALPAFWILEKRMRLRFRHFAAAVALIAVIPFVLFDAAVAALWLIAGPGLERIVESTPAAVYSASVGMAGGVAVGLVLWLILGKEGAGLRPSLPGRTSARP